MEAKIGEGPVKGGIVYLIVGTPRRPALRKSGDKPEVRVTDAPMAEKMFSGGDMGFCPGV